VKCCWERECYSVSSTVIYPVIYAQKNSSMVFMADSMKVIFFRFLIKVMSTLLVLWLRLELQHMSLHKCGWFHESEPKPHYQPASWTRMAYREHQICDVIHQYKVPPSPPPPKKKNQCVGRNIKKNNFYVPELKWKMNCLLVVLYGKV
jgi:hypothetical protein